MQSPFQDDVDAFYGNPRGRGGAVYSRNWYNANMVYVSAPFKMNMGKVKVTRFPMHRKCAQAAQEWLNQVWINAGRNQKTIDLWGMNVFSGSFNYRVMRGGDRLSMHAYGCAVDFDAPQNGLFDNTPNLAKYRNEIILPALKLGAVWGGDWNGNGLTADEPRCDGMHFQFAKLK